MRIDDNITRAVILIICSLILFYIGVIAREHASYVQCTRYGKTTTTIFYGIECNTMKVSK